MDFRPRKQIRIQTTWPVSNVAQRTCVQAKVQGMAVVQKDTGMHARTAPNALTMLTVSQRSPVVKVKAEDHDDRGPHANIADNSHMYRLHAQRVPSRGMTSQAHMEQQYVDQFATHHLQFEPDFGGADMNPGTYGQHPQHQVPHHHIGPSSAGNMTLTPYGRGGPPVSLPSVASLQAQAFRDHLREAERRVDNGQYESAEEALNTAMRSLTWMKAPNA